MQCNTRRSEPAAASSVKPQLGERQARRRTETLEYPEHFVVKKITTGGTFRFRHRLLYLANAMVDEQIGLDETDDGVWNVFFNTVLLATLDQKDYIIRG